MKDDSNVLKFPDIKAYREHSKKIEDVMLLGKVDISRDTYLTMVGEFMEIRQKNGNHPIGNYPQHKFDKFLFLKTLVSLVHIDILSEALRKEGIDVEGLLNDDAVCLKVLQEKHSRPD